LATLQERAPELPFDVVRGVIERELGRSIETLFTRFEQRPVAAASLAQVHRAILPDGSRVAVKVQRPDLDRLVNRDLDAIGAGLRWLAWALPRRTKRTNVLAFFTEFQRYTLQELDFANEGRAIERFRANFQERNEVHFPRVFSTHTTSRVLTMDWIDGMRLPEAAAALSEERRSELVTRLVDVLLKMFVSDGFFHADLHPGNIVFHPDGTFTLVDFGMYGELTSAERDRFILYWLAVVQRQTRRAFHHFKRQTQILPGADEGAFFRRFATLAEEFYTSPLREMSFMKVYLEMIKAGYANGFVFPSELMLHAKALTTAEALIFVLAPNVRFEQLSRPAIAREFAARTASIELLGRRISQLAPELLLLGEMLPSEAIDDDWEWGATKELAGELRDQCGDVIGRSLEHGGLWKMLLEANLRSALTGTTLAGEVDAIVSETWDRYDALELTVRTEPTIGAVLTTHLAALTLASDETLRQHGLSTQESQRLIYNVGWSFYSKLGEPAWLVATALTRDPSKRLRLATDLFRHFPFGSPGYGWRDTPTENGIVAFDCVRCPVAAFFAAHGASELCVNTWCALDVPLAQKWGGRLERTATIAMGANHCDFRWHPAKNAPSAVADVNER
jgi:ubiquinone biosynthesis protein